MTEWDLAYMRRKVEPQGLTDADIDAIADAVSIDNRATTWHRRFARAVLAAQPLHEQLREMGEAHAAQPAPVPQCSPTLTECPRCKNDIKQCPLAAPVPVPLPVAERAMLHDAAHIINRAARTKGDHWDCVGSLLTRLADGGIAASPEVPK